MSGTRWIGIVVLACCANGVVAGEPPQAGAKIRVKLDEDVVSNGKVVASKRDGWIVGTLTSSDADSLTIATGDDGALHAPKSAIEKMQVSQGQSRAKGAWIGAGVGAFVGLVAAYREQQHCEDDAAHGAFIVVPCEVSYSFVLVGAPLGALVGMLFKTDKWIDSPSNRVSLEISPTNQGVQFGAAIRF